MEVISFSAAEFPLVAFSGQKRRKIKIISFCYFCSYGLFSYGHFFLAGSYVRRNS